MALPYPMAPVSPFDVITSQAENEKIANIEAIYNGELANNAITANKLDYTTLAFGNYSTTEVDTGFKWIDGKAIYKKTVSLGTLPNAVYKVVAHGVANIDMGIGIEGVANDTVNVLPLPYVSPVTGENILLNFNKTQISVNTGANRSGYTGYATILYTKT